MSSDRALPCGCRRGFFLCPEAERLWAEVNRTYAAARASRDFRHYDVAVGAYERHFAAQEARS